MWRYKGDQRPEFAIPATEDQESVWDYPRPPRLEPDARKVQVRCGEEVIAESQRSIRVLETASPPVFYIPPDDVRMPCLKRTSRSSMCEWKG